MTYMDDDAREMIQEDLPYLVCSGDEVIAAFTDHGDAQVFLGILGFRQDASGQSRLWIDSPDVKRHMR